MPSVLGPVNLQAAIAVGQDILVLHPNELRCLGVLREQIRLQFVRSLEDYLLVEPLILLARDDCRALGHIGAKPVRMIGMVMAVDVVQDRLVGD